MIGDILSYIMQLSPDFSAALAAQAEAHAREKWGGDRVYIQRKGGTHSQRNTSIKRDYQAGERIELLERRYSLKASRLWEIIGLKIE